MSDFSLIIVDSETGEDVGKDYSMDVDMPSGSKCPA